MNKAKYGLAAAILCSAGLILTGCEEQEDNTIANQTTGSITRNTHKKPIKAKQAAMQQISVEHTVKFNGQEIPVVATYGIDKRYVNNWWFTNNEEINLAIKPAKILKPNAKLGVNNVYADVAIVSKYVRYNGIRQDSLDESYSNLPNGYVAINKQNGFDLPFQVESINENEISFDAINGYGSGESSRITEAELRNHAYGAKLNVVWTLAIKENGETYFKTVHDTIGLPYQTGNNN